jgi:hypothetical protein
MSSARLLWRVRGSQRRPPDRRLWADTYPTIVAYGTPAIDVKRSFPIAAVEVTVGGKPPVRMVAPVGWLDRLNR